MTHQTQLEKLKYRNWVKGGLSMKYLKDGLEKFADDVVRQDHRRILQQILHTTGVTCSACTLRDFKPVHKCVLDSTTKRKRCPHGQSNCNCLYPNKLSCPNKICDAIYEDILNSHASSPPTPCLKNTDITKWVTNPWEIAKCFINAPGYRDKQSAEEIDVAGLLHVFINNKMYQTSLSCLISGNKSDAFCKALDLRNKIFHSPYLELDDKDLNELLRNVVSILEDERKLKGTQPAKEAVDNIKLLQNQEFIITTETEASVLREIVEQKINKLDVFNSELAEKHIEHEKRQSEIEDKHSGLGRRTSELEKKHLELEQRNSEIDQRLDTVEKDMENMKNLHQNKLILVEKRLDAQRKLADHLQEHYVKTSVSPLKTRENTIDIDKIYVKPKIEIVKKDSSANNQNVMLTSYKNIFQSNENRMRRIYLVGEVGSG